MDDISNNLSEPIDAVTANAELPSLEGKADAHIANVDNISSVSDPMPSIAPVKQQNVPERVLNSANNDDDLLLATAIFEIENENCYKRPLGKS